MRHFALLRRPAAALLALILAVGCASEPTSTEQDALAGIRVTANVTGTPIATLVVEVTAADITTPLVFNLVVDAVTGVASGTVRVPHGPARTFHIAAFDEAGDTTHEGQATVDVRPGQNDPLQITLGPRSGHVPVTVSFGAFSVIVTPSSATLTVAGETVQLAAQVIDEYGTPLPEGTPVQWATTNPALVTVDANGLVTAVGQAGAAFSGAALIVATYEGVAGFSTIQPAEGSGTEDLDADGYVAAGDCDDTRSDVHPGATELLDGADNDCDGSVDENFQMVIAEVQAIADPTSFDWGEWIEVWNASGEEVNPDGLMLVVNNQSCRVSASTPVPAHGYFTINFGLYAELPYQFACTSELGTLTSLPDALLDLQLGSGTLVSGEPVLGIVLDHVSLPDFAVTGRPRSLDPFATDVTANDSFTNWCLSPVAGGTPLQGNPPCP